MIEYHLGYQVRYGGGLGDPVPRIGETIYTEVDGIKVAFLVDDVTWMSCGHDMLLRPQVWAHWIRNL